MKPNSPIGLSLSVLENTIKRLRTTDTVKLTRLGSDLADAEKIIFLKPGGSFSKILGFLSSKSQREKNAADACKKIDFLFSGTQYETSIDSLKKNIRQKIIETGFLTGNFLSRNLEALKDNNSL